MQFPRLTPFVKKLLIGLLSIYIGELVLQNWLGVGVFEVLALNHGALSPATLWQVLTYVVVAPPGPQHVVGVLIGLVFLWWILAPFEERFGVRRTAQLTVVAALSASVPALLASQGLLLAGVQRLFPPLYGTNPVMLAAVAGFAESLRGRGTLSFFGAIPMQPKHLIYVVIGLSVLFFLASGNVVELVADLGAVAGGMGFVRWISRPRRPSHQAPGRRSASLRVLPGSGNKPSSNKPPRWLN